MYNMVELWCCGWVGNTTTRAGATMIWWLIFECTTTGMGVHSMVAWEITGSHWYKKIWNTLNHSLTEPFHARRLFYILSNHILLQNSLTISCYCDGCFFCDSRRLLNIVSISQNMFLTVCISWTFPICICRNMLKRSHLHTDMSTCVTLSICIWSTGVCVARMCSQSWNISKKWSKSWEWSCKDTDSKLENSPIGNLCWSMKEDRLVTEQE